MMEFFEYVKQQADRRQTYGELQLKNHIPNIPSVAISDAVGLVGKTFNAFDRGMVRDRTGEQGS